MIEKDRSTFSKKAEEEMYNYNYEIIKTIECHMIESTMIISATLNKQNQLKRYHLVDNLNQSNYMSELRDRKNLLLYLKIAEEYNEYLQEILKIMAIFLQAIYETERKESIELENNEKELMPLWLYHACFIGEKKKTKAKYKNGEVSLYNQMPLVILYDIEEEAEELYQEPNEGIYINEDRLKVGSYFNWEPNKNHKNENKQEKENTQSSPIIIQVMIDQTEDYLYLLTEWRKLFRDNSYKTSVVVTEEEGVLYDLEYLPLEFLESDTSKVEAYLYQLSKKNKSEIIIICGAYKFSEMINTITIEIVKISGYYLVTCNRRKKEKIDMNFRTINFPEISEMYEKIICLM